MFKVPEKYRLRKGNFSSSEIDGNNGIFIIPIPHNLFACCIASDGEGWEHVSIHIATKRNDLNRCPTWEEMCIIKELFWESEDCVIQFHPPKSNYVNNHKYCLHLWKPIGIKLPIPYHSLVGIK